MRYWYLLLLLLFVFCWPEPKRAFNYINNSAFVDSTPVVGTKDSILSAKMVAFAEMLIGTRYVFGCTAPSTGFDCSGFITYVFNHFNITVPRSSVDFTNAGTTIPLLKALPGDLILFTGTSSRIRVVGHIGMIVLNNALGISFIQASSGKENAVIITVLNERYMERFVKVVRMVD